MPLVQHDDGFDANTILLFSEQITCMTLCHNKESLCTEFTLCSMQLFSRNTKETLS